MELKAIDFETLKVGDVIRNSRNGQDCVIADVSRNSVAIETPEGTKVITQGTIKRWYRMANDARRTPKNEEFLNSMDKAYNRIEQVVEQQPSEDEPKETESQEIEPPVQDAKTAIKRAPNSQKQDPVIEALRNDIIKETLAECPNATEKVTGSYTALKVGKYNFAEVYKGKRRFAIRVIADALDKELLDMCVVAPKTFGWTLDTTFTVLVPEDKENAIKILKSSYAYRSNNTPKRGFTKNK